MGRVVPLGVLFVYGCRAVLFGGPKTGPNLENYPHAFTNKTSDRHREFGVLRNNSHIPTYNLCRNSVALMGWIVHRLTLLLNPNTKNCEDLCNGRGHQGLPCPSSSFMGLGMRG